MIIHQPELLGHLGMISRNPNHDSSEVAVRSWSNLPRSIPHSEVSGSWLGSGFLGCFAPGIMKSCLVSRTTAETPKKTIKKPGKKYGKYGQINEKWMNHDDQPWENGCDVPTLADHLADLIQGALTKHVMYSMEGLTVGIPEGPRDHSKGGKHTKTPWRTYPLVMSK